MRTDATSEQLCPATDGLTVEQLAEARGVRKFIHTMHRVANAHLDALQDSKDPFDDLRRFAGLIRSLESALDIEDALSAAQLISSSSSALEHHLMELGQPMDHTWRPSPPSPAQEQLQAVETLPVPDRPCRDHQLVPEPLPVVDVFGPTGVLLTLPRSVIVCESEARYGQH